MTMRKGYTATDWVGRRAIVLAAALALGAEAADAPSPEGPEGAPADGQAAVEAVFDGADGGSTKRDAAAIGAEAGGTDGDDSADEAGMPAGASVAPDDDLASVLACMRANLPDRLRLRSFTLHRTDSAGGERITRGRMYMRRREGRAEVNVQLQSPPEAAGTSYLWRELESRDETIVYLPALERTRRVVGSGQETKLLGTDFTLRDIQQVQGAFAGGQTRLLGEDTFQERPSWRVRFLPAADDPGAYLYVDADIDQETCVTLAADFVAEEGVVRRYRADPESLRDQDGFSYAQRITMEDLRAGSHTVADIETLDAPETLPHRLFSPTGFHLGN